MRSSVAGSPCSAVEAAASFGWSRWADATVSLDHFGASGPGDEVLAHFGFTAENVADKARELLEKSTGKRVSAEAHIQEENE